MLAGVWWGNARESGHSEDLGIGWRIVLNGSSINSLKRRGMG